MNLKYIFNQDSVVLIAVFALLIIMSVLSWYIIFWKYWNLRKERLSLIQFNKDHINSPNWPVDASIKNVGGSVDLLVKEAEKLKPILALYKPEERKEILAMHLVQSLDLIRVWLDKGLTILASIGSSAPFIGLFGTVVGIYGALTKIALQGNAGLDVVAGPMGEALVATAIGLFAAIPAVLAYNAFVRLNRLLVQDLRHIAEQLTIYISLTPTALAKKNKIEE
jgi:biopolymer transport protein ExbB